VNATYEVLADGYQLVEAPRVGDDGAVFFSDALAGGVYRWTSGGGVETVVPKRRGVGGMALHRDGGVVVSGRDITHVQPDGTNRLLFGPPEGATGFNDMCATADGAVLAGALRFMPFTGVDPVSGEFWHITSPSHAEIVLEDVLWANGVGDDGERWCCCDYARGTVTELARDGSERVYTMASGEADGLAFDDHDGMWVAQPRHHSLVRLDRDGDIERTLDLPGHQPASVAFDGDTMYVTTIASESTSGALLRVDAGVSGPRHHKVTI